jgi:YVTN family beta-propeller protein
MIAGFGGGDMKRVKWIRTLTVALTLLPCVQSGAAQNTPREALLALSKRDHTLAIVDPATLEVVARVPVGADPHEVTASSDGRRAYVSIYGGGRYHALSVVDLEARKALPEIDTGALNGPHGLAFVGGKVWFTAEGAKAVARFDPATSRIDWILGTGQNRTHMIHVTADEKKLYTTNVSSATVSLIEQVTLPGPGQARIDWNQTLIAVGKGAEGFDVSPDGRELWTANAQDGSISIVDLRTNQVSATLDAKIFASNRLKFTPDGALVLVTSLRDGDLFVYDAAARKERKRVPIGHGAAGILMDPSGARAFVACTPDDYVALVDLKTLEVTRRLDVGAQPDGLAWATRTSP